LPDATSSLRLDRLESRLIYCPARTLHAATGAPGPGCLFDLATLAAGPSALTGAGTIVAALALTGNAAACPSSVQVAGQVATPGGDIFDLSAHLALSTGGRQRGCRPVGGRIDLTFVEAIDRAEDDLPIPDSLPAPLQARLDALARLDEQQWALLDELLQLNDAEWRTLEELLALPESQFADAARTTEPAPSLMPGGQNAK
jgi:hypothetical protein